MWIFLIVIAGILLPVFFGLYGNELTESQSGAIVGTTLVFLFWCAWRALRSTPRYRLKHLRGTGIRGTASALSGPPETELRNAANVIGSATLRVSLPNRKPYLVEQTIMVSLKHLSAFKNQDLPVWVDPDNFDCVFIDWDEVPTNDELVQQRHESLNRKEGWD